MSTFLKKLPRSSVIQSVIDSLTQAMLDGDLKPGDQIPTEMELVEQLGVSRNSIREAIKILVYLGVLEIRRSEGTFVCNGFSDNLMDPMIYGMILNQQNTTELNELRAMIESGVLELAIQKCTDEEINELKTRLADLKIAIFSDKPDYKKVFELDNAFHETITTMGHNGMVTKINSMVMLLTNTVRQNSVKAMITSGRGAELYQAHERVYNLVANRQTEDLFSSIRGTYFVEEGDTIEEEEE